MEGPNNIYRGTKQSKKYSAQAGVVAALLLCTALGIHAYGQAMGRINLEDGNEPEPPAPMLEQLPAKAPATPRNKVTPAPTRVQVSTPAPTVQEITPPPAKVAPAPVVTPKIEPVVTPEAVSEPTISPQDVGSKPTMTISPVPTISHTDSATISPKVEPAETTDTTPKFTSSLPHDKVDGNRKPAAPENTSNITNPPQAQGIENQQIGHPNSLTKDANNPPKTSTGTSFWDNFYSTCQVLGALAIVLGLIFTGKSFLKKFVPGAAVGSGKGVLEVLARYPLAKGQALVLVRLGSQVVLLCQTRESSRSLLVISEPNEVAGILGQVQGSKPNSIQAGFSRLLSHATKEMEQEPLETQELEDTAVAEMPKISVRDDLPSEQHERVRANQKITVSEKLDEELDEMAAARRQLLELRRQVKSVSQKLSV